MEEDLHEALIARRQCDGASAVARAVLGVQRVVARSRAHVAHSSRKVDCDCGTGIVAQIEAVDLGDGIDARSRRGTDGDTPKSHAAPRKGRKFGCGRTRSSRCRSFDHNERKGCTGQAEMTNVHAVPRTRLFMCVRSSPLGWVTTESAQITRVLDSRKRLRHLS